MGTIINATTGDKGFATLAFFRRNGIRKNDGFEPECVYQLFLVRTPGEDEITVVPQSTTPGPTTEYPSMAAFERYWEHWGNRDYTGPVYPAKCH